MFNGMRSASGLGKKLMREVMDAQEMTVVFRRYIDPQIDQLTGDPISTSGNDFTDYSIAAFVSDTDDYSSKIDRDWTGDITKRLRVYVYDSVFIPAVTDVLFIDYSGGLFPYRIFGIRKLNSRYQIDVERIDRAAN